MALPAGLTALGSFKGAKGDKGDTGTFSEALATSVAAAEPASVVITGAFGQTVEFKIPRGLPGVNAVANDEATAAYLAAVDSETHSAAKQVIGTEVDPRVIVRFSSGSPDRPNIILGGLLNGSDILPGTIHSVLGQPGGPGYNNIIGGDGTLTVGTSTPNVLDPTITNVGVSNIFGYDNVVGSISGKINSDHSYTEKGGAGHNAIFGGQGHVIRAAGKFAFIAGGDSNDIGGEYAFATGLQNEINGSGAFGAGKVNTISTAAAAAVVFGTENVLTGIFSYANGYRNKVDGTAGSAEGAYAYSRSAFQRALAGGRNVTDGDAQTSVCAYHLVTTDAVSRALVANYTGVGAGSQFVVQPGQSVAFTAVVVGRTAGGATAVALEIKGLAQRPTSGNAVIVGTPTVTAIYQPDPLVTASMAINAAAGYLSILVKGTAGVEIRWAARFTTTEVIA